MSSSAPVCVLASPEPHGFDAELAAARQLRFSPDLARRYERETGAERARVIAWRGLAGLAIFIAYLAVDFLLTRDSFGLALVLRLGLVAPIGVLALLLCLRNPPLLVREGLPALVCVLGGAATIVIMVASTSPLREYHHYSLTLLVFFLAALLPIRLAFALPAALAIFGMDLLSFVLMPATDRALVTSELVILLAGTVLSLFAGVSFEANMRLAYVAGQAQRRHAHSLEDLNRRDPLTGLGNRRALAELSATLSARVGAEVAVIVADIDHFKSYNDALGHPAGDRCLARVASLIAAQLRGGEDTAIRYGGEEFLVVLPGADLWTAIGIAERIRAAIETAAIPHPGRPLTALVTASLGVSASRILDATSIEAIVSGADSALYAAKQAGRNQVWPRPRSRHEVVALARTASAA